MLISLATTLSVENKYWYRNNMKSGFKKNKFKCQQIEPPSGSWIKFPTPTTKSSKCVNPLSKFSGYTTAWVFRCSPAPSHQFTSLLKPSVGCLRDRRSDSVRPCDDSIGFKTGFLLLLLHDLESSTTMESSGSCYIVHEAHIAVFLFASDIPRKWRAGF